MKNVKAYKSSNALERVPPVPPASVWPPPWMAAQGKTADAADAADPPFKPQEPPPPPPARTTSDCPPELSGWDEITVEEFGEPCPQCGSLEKWSDPYGSEHCQQCKPIHRALALADLAARIRNRSHKP